MRHGAYSSPLPLSVLSHGYFPLFLLDLDLSWEDAFFHCFSKKHSDETACPSPLSSHL